ncbi:MAG: DUF1499 domain-containing protein [Zhongshania sp.]|uniref:DUF1499 domain-containing protein n=1 Tax=Zhongshania sp. TaxID=1971902 RepID=UPI0026222265|nr:DUF1499 domain-containing protein [Zhongshania sp.]MDF1690961.1 DUF1499 domain-containing protein [Zhongshania sp.]
MSIPSLTLNLAVISLLLLGFSTATVRYELINYQIGLTLFSFAGLLSLISIGASALFTRRTTSVQGRRKLNSAAFIALPAILFLSLSLFRGAGAPLINDVSTNTQQPPKFLKAPDLRGPADNSLTYMGTNIALQEQAYPHIKTYQSPLSLVESQNLSFKIASEMGWLVYYQQKGHIEAQTRSFWFGFIDDIVIQIQANDAGALIDLRSASRLGKGDFGANAQRITAFLETFSLNEQTDIAKAATPTQF